MDLSQYELIIFDFDDTIAHLDVDWSGLKDDLAKMFGRPFRPLELVLEVMEGKEKQEAHAFVEQKEIEGIEGMYPIKSTVDIIMRMKSNGKKMAILTANSRACIVKALAKLGLSEIFDEMVCREDVKRHKPDPEGLFAILDKTGTSPDKAIYIGDRQKDMDTAVAAGMHFVFVTELGDVE